MHRAFVGAASAACFLAGCITAVGPDFQLKDDASTGVIAVSVTASGTIPRGLAFQFRPAGDTSRSRGVLVFSTKDVVDWPIPDSGRTPVDQPPGRLAILEIAPGEYEFFRWSGFSGAMRVESGTPFSKRFEVRAGEVVYLGNLHLITRDKKWVVSSSDRHDRDFPLLAKKLPNVPQERIVTRLLK